LRVPLDTGWLVRGTVRDADGRPLEKVFVETAYRAHGEFSRADGSFAVHDLPRGLLSVGFVAHRKGYLEERLSLDSPALPVWEETLDIVLRRAP
jgi:hypothetical protein